MLTLAPATGWPSPPTSQGNATVFDEALADFAETYADQNEKDFELFKEAISSGRITGDNGGLGH